MNTILPTIQIPFPFLFHKTFKERPYKYTTYFEVAGNVYIYGSEGTFYEVNSGYWEDALQNGFISIGSLKLRYISKLKGTIYSGQELWNYHTGSTVTEVRWSANGELTLSSDGNTLYVSTINPFEGGTGNSEYTRVNP